MSAPSRYRYYTYFGWWCEASAGQQAWAVYAPDGRRMATAAHLYTALLWAAEQRP